MNRVLINGIVWAAVGFGLISCREEASTVSPERLLISPPRITYKVGASSEERFPRYADGSKRFRYVPGSSWAELRSTRFRSLNFAFGPDGVGECYLSEISGFVDGGLANINRWREQQMGLARMTEAELANLPRKAFAGGEAVFVKIDGSFQGMGDSSGREGYRMLGMLMTRGCEAYSVKMTGPRSLVEREESEFLAFCETLTILPDPNAEPYAALKVGPFEFLRPCDWEYFVPPGADPVVRRPLGFRVGPNQEAIADMGIILDAAQGAPTQVINGWLTELGQEAMTPEGIAGLPDQVLMGSRGKLLEAVQGDQKLVGIVAQLSSEGHAPMTVVATLRGPASVVDDEKIMLRTFAESMRLGPVGAPAGSPH